MRNTYNKIKRINAMLQANPNNTNLIEERDLLIESYKLMTPKPYEFPDNKRKEYDFGNLKKEEVVKIYEMMIENIKNIPFETKWINVEYLNTIPTKCTYDLMAEEHNNNYTRHKKIDFLAKDILINGTYWPIIVNEEDGPTYTILEGSHRVDAIKSTRRKYEFFAITSKPKPINEDITIKLPYGDDIEYLKGHANYGPIYKHAILRVGEDGTFYYATISKNKMKMLGNLFAIYMINAFGVGLRNYMELYSIKPSEIPGNEYINKKHMPN